MALRLSEQARLRVCAAVAIGVWLAILARMAILSTDIRPGVARTREHLAIFLARLCSSPRDPVRATSKSDVQHGVITDAAGKAFAELVTMGIFALLCSLESRRGSPRREDAAASRLRMSTSSDWAAQQETAGMAVRSFSDSSLSMTEETTRWGAFTHSLSGESGLAMIEESKTSAEMGDRLREGIEAALSVKSAEKWTPETAIPAFAKLRRGVLHAAGHVEAFEREAVHASKVFNFLVDLLKHHPIRVKQTQDVLTGLVSHSSWAEALTGSERLRHRIRTELRENAQAAFAFCGADSQPELTTRASIEEAARRLEHESESYQAGPFVTAMILLHCIFPTFPSSPQVDMGSISACLGLLWSLGPRKCLSMVKRDPMHKITFVCLVLFCLGVNICIFIGVDATSDVFLTAAASRLDLFRGPGYLHRLYLYLAGLYPGKSLNPILWTKWCMAGFAIFASGAWKTLLFRGIYLGRLTALMPFWAANMIVGITYALALEPATMSGDGTLRVHLVQCLPLMVTSMWCGYLYRKSGNFVIIMIAHLLFDAGILWLHFSAPHAFPELVKGGRRR
mmetsp:Transcript_73449/g.204015  ORF Transcript_73449/g.204015 Transcript_73449/m.204015 type:complete len:566 (-) Transcript_73449:61-1758(-)